MRRTEQPHSTLQPELSRLSPAAIALLWSDHADGAHVDMADADCPECLSYLVASRAPSGGVEDEDRPS